VTPEQLETRWVTAAGRDILQQVIADLQEEGGLNLPAILSALEGAEEVADGLDLRYAPLEGEQLDEVNLYAVDLTGAFLNGARLQKADIRDANLEGALLEGVDLRGSYLSNSQLEGALLKGANLSGAMLDGANLTGANLLGANCLDTYFAGATLDGADLRQANLNQADFTESGCRGTVVTQGAMDRVAAPPLDPGGLVVEAPPRARLTRRPGGGSGAMRRPPSGARSRATAPLRSGPRGPRRPLRGAHGGEPPARDWDQALLRLIPLRGAATRIVVVVDGEERVLFEL
jgi:uncharacterized protein YjbI with pentapeptide repeats